MNKRSMYRVALVAAVVLTTAALVPMALVARQSGTGEAQASDVRSVGDQHRDKLRAALPGNGGESKEGPGSAEAAALAALAYPDTDIPLERLVTERQDGERVKGRLPRGGSDGWNSVGPSNAVYPFFGPRDLTVYVPNEYTAGGRVNAMALAPDCRRGNCRLWIGPAGGGVWRTNDALAATPKWSFLSSSFGINAIGSMTLDPTDPTSNTIWVGTGEANTCGSGCVHGVGLFKSTDGGETWSEAIGTSTFGGRGIGSIAVDPRNPNVVYASSTMGLHGMSSVCCSGIQRIVIPGAKQWGVYKSTDGGQNWSFIHSGAATTAECGTDITLIAANATPCTPRGVRVVVLDPSNPDVVYASSYARGVWRSTNGGSTWTQIKASLNSAIGTTLPWVAVTRLANGNTRMYISEGHTNARVPAGGPRQFSRVFRSDKVQSGTPTWSDLTSSNPADSRWGTFNFCTGQCWYDNYVYTPKGSPDIVYVGGSYSYGEPFANHRAVVLSTDGGTTWTDMTSDSTDSVHPNALHPDQHFIVTNPANPFQFIEANDGGVMRSSGQFANVSSWCDSRGLSAVRLTRCKQMLSRVPTRLSGINKGLTTLQFQSLSVSPFDSNELQGGTQDNGTWENFGKTDKWLNTIIGDGGQSGFDVADRHFRFHNFFEATAEVNFSDGAMEDWNWIADPIFETENQEFYVPMISDPRVSKTLFVGTEHVWRTKTAGQGTLTLAELRKHCNEWFGDFDPKVTCGDWEPLGGPTLTDPSFGSRALGDVVAVARASSDTSTLWAATSRGRVFVSQNADAEPAASVSFSRIDSLAANAPNRYITSIYVDPANANHAWISYSGFSSATPTTPGHVFEVTYNPGGGTATWTSRDAEMGDLPITALVRDDAMDTLYAGTDYGVIRLESGDDSWTLAAEGMPNVEVPGLTIVPGSRQ
ncbi:MAG TPA: sialidase family protein, partial [Candidatus Dormibacteraeota bacterium]|nr:sialidase family protein [Candidatus Dormibacteraeota bacterium]